MGAVVSDAGGCPSVSEQEIKDESRREIAGGITEVWNSVVETVESSR